MPEANSIHVLRFSTWSTYAVTSSLIHLIGYLKNSSSLLVADVFSQHLVNLARNSFLVTRKRVNIFTPPPPLMLQAVAILEYATPMNFALIASPIQAALSSPLSLKCCYAGYPSPVFSFFYVGTKCCFDHADLITLQHKRLIYLTTIWIKLAGRGPLHFRLTLNSNFLLSQIWIKRPRHLFKDSR